MEFFDVKSIFFTTLGHPTSYLEFFGIVTGAIAVWLSARANIWSWPIGISNVVLLFFLFFQVQLYPDMFLQIFFFVTNLLGWWRWANPRTGEADRKRELRVSWMPRNVRVISIAAVLAGTFLFGSFASSLHEILPRLFSRPSAYPYIDSFVMVTSIVATYMMVQKNVECWLAWIIADVVATYLYFAKDLLFVGVEYFVFCLIAAFGFWRWPTPPADCSIRCAY